MATRRIINCVWPQRDDGLIETYLPHSTEKDIINGAIVPRNRTPFSPTITNAMTTEKRASSERSISGEKPNCQD
jgi:hypothetical protein